MRQRRRQQTNGNGEGGGEEPTALVNSGARAETIRAVAKYITEREAEIKVIREDITAYKATHIKGDLGMKLGDFGAVLRIYKMETEPRDAFLDTLREGFKALGLGGQLDWINAGASEPTEQREADNA